MGAMREAAPNAGRNRRMREIHKLSSRSGQLRIKSVTGDILVPQLRGRNGGGIAASKCKIATAQPEDAKPSANDSRSARFGRRIERTPVCCTGT